MSTEGVDSEPRPNVGSIKGLIKIFEKISDQKKTNIPKPDVKWHKPGSKNITETFDQIDKQKRESEKEDEVASQLEKRVSVRSLVCNFQKLGTDKDLQTTSAKRANLSPKLVDFPKTKNDNENRNLASTSPAGGVKVTVSSTTQPSTSSGSLFDVKPPTMPKMESISPSKAESEETTTEVSSEEEVATSGGYCLGGVELSPSRSAEVSDTELTDDEDVDIIYQIPLGTGITPLPVSYKVISSKNGRLDLKLPDPPKKGALRSQKRSHNHNVVFKEECEVGETYNMGEYTRADPDLDIVAATAEYEFEKMLERMEKIPVSMKRSPNEKLGLQVYGVSVRTSNEHNNMAIYVKSVTPGSLCERSGAIQVDDLIIEINGESLIGVGVSKVHEVIQKSTDTITLLLGREPRSPYNDYNS